MFEYCAKFSKAADELDRHDLTDILKDFHGIDAYEIIERIDDLGDAKKINAIHSLTVDELVLYLERRYKMKTTEEVRYFMWWGKE